MNGGPCFKSVCNGRVRRFPRSPAACRTLESLQKRTRFSQRSAASTKGFSRYVWESWAEQEDIDALTRWAERFGPGYQGLLVFTYHVLPEVELPADTEDLFVWRNRRYLLRAVDVEDYRRHLRVRSPRWRTVCLPRSVFLALVRPVQHFTHGLPLIPDECPF